MINDLNNVLSDPFEDREFDVCICGAGIAGITLALNLSSKLNILLLEAGGFEPTIESRSVYEGQIVGHDYMDLAAGRLRFFGGTSNHWGGDCRPLDKYDFEPKSFLQYSGWPIQQSDLAPYLKSAESILDVSSDVGWRQPEGYLQEKLDSTADFQSINFRESAPTRFGQKYRRDLETRSNITCYLNANVTQLSVSDDHSKLDNFEVSSYSGKRYQARARIFVLATGGIENPRLLLNSNKQVSAGLGNQNGLVGKFFSDHLFATVAELILEDDENMNNYIENNQFGDSFKGRLKKLVCGSPTLLGAARDIAGKNVSCRSRKNYFSPTPEFMEREQILNFSLRLNFRAPGHGRDTDGIVVISSEQAPNPRSSVTLGSELDQFGMRRVKLDWRVEEIDYFTLQRAVLRFGEVFAESNLGRLKVPDWLLSDPEEFPVRPGNHHTGTTRMGESPATGVVDSNQRVFGVPNLYMAGSSVFATGGHANATFTIVQTTLRLADHINSL